MLFFKFCYTTELPPPQKPSTLPSLAITGACGQKPAPVQGWPRQGSFAPQLYSFSWDNHPGWLQRRPAHNSVILLQGSVVPIGDQVQRLRGGAKLGSSATPFPLWRSAAPSCHWAEWLTRNARGQLYQCNRHTTHENCCIRTTSSAPQYSISVVIWSTFCAIQQ
jgi:hypothetical protein